MVPAPNTSSKRRWVKRFFRVPYLAAAISVGFHGVLFASGPTFPELTFDGVDDQIAAQNPRQVPLLELTAAEQQRLPDFSRSFYNLDNLGNLETLDSLLGGSSLDQDFNQSTNDSGIDSLQILPAPGPPQTYTASILEALGARQRRYRPENNAAPQSTPEDDPTPTTEAEPEGELPALPANVNPNPETPEIAIAPGAAGLESTSEAPDIAIDPEMAAAAEGITLNEWLAMFTYESTATTREEADVRLGDFLQTGVTLAQDLGIQVEEPQSLLVDSVEPLRLNYDRRVCLPVVPTDGEIGALVRPEGILANEPDVLKSTGYIAFDQQARQIVENFDFYAIEELTAYRFQVRVNYDAENCIDMGQGITLPSDTEETQSFEPDAESDAAEQASQPKAE
ncbi:MAG: hypothetical protein AAGH78_01690 [Cyanobacteria bacterium P01_H01_bin.58]